MAPLEPPEELVDAALELEPPLPDDPEVDAPVALPVVAPLEPGELPPELDDVAAGLVWQAAQTIKPTTVRNSTKHDFLRTSSSCVIDHAPVQRTPPFEGDAS